MGTATWISWRATSGKHRYRATEKQPFEFTAMILITQDLRHCPRLLESGVCYPVGDERPLSRIRFSPKFPRTRRLPRRVSTISTERRIGESLAL